jgi:hypothetical protein
MAGMRVWKLLRITKYTALVLLFFSSVHVHAQAKFYTLVSEGTVGYQKTFQVQYIIEGAKKIENFRNSLFTDFIIQDEFEIPSSPTISAQTSQLVDAYSKIVVLSPTKTGVLTVPGATAKIDGKLMHSNPVKITVRQSSLSSMPDPDDEKERVEDESEIKPGESIEEKIRKNFFLKGETNKHTCYVGEAVMVVYKAYSRLNANSQVVKRPSLTGFSVIEMVDSYDNRPQVEKINGKPFYTHLIRKVQLFPLQEGTFELDAAEVESTIYFMRNSDTGTADDLQWLLERSTIDQPAVFTRVEYKTTLKSKPFSVSVKPLPKAGQPDNFSGAVGEFNIGLRLIKSELQQGEPGKLQVMISGNGNFPLVTAPEIEWPEGIEVLDPLVKEDLNKFIYPLKGGKIFEYPFSCKDTGSFTIPAVEFSYFDPNSKKYITKKSSSTTFHVAKGKIQKQFITRAIPVKFDPPTPVYWYWVAMIGMAITGYAIYMVWNRRRPSTKLKATRKEEVLDKKESIENIFEDPFSRARQALYSGDKMQFYTETQRVLWKTVADKCKVNPSALNKQNVAVQLRECKIHEDIITELQYVLNECEWAVYTPSSDEKNMNKLLASAQKIKAQLL